MQPLSRLNRVSFICCCVHQYHLLLLACTAACLFVLMA